LLLTIVGLTRALYPKAKEEIPIDLSSITDPYKGTGFKIPSIFIKEWVKKNSLVRSNRFCYG
jgi:hypothetical protein